MTSFKIGDYVQLKDFPGGRFPTGLESPISSLIGLKGVIMDPKRDSGASWMISTPATWGSDFVFALTWILEPITDPAEIAAAKLLQGI